MNISIIGGTGKLGFALAKRLSSIGKPVMIGSRDKEKAVAKAEEINDTLNRSMVKGDTTTAAAQWGDLIFMTVPQAAQLDTVKQIKPFINDKIIVDTTVPLEPGNPTNQIDSVKSTAELVAEILENTNKIAWGFHTISHTVLNNLEEKIEGDVLICSDDTDSIKLLSELIEELGARPVNAGNLKNARVLERLTPMIIGMNKRYKKRHIGIKITGL